ncbi:MAG: folate-binding protein YgfZ [Erythrobacter sp.]|nr:folate-binding protein YgfZ [Erythrobacter sp.]
MGETRLFNRAIVRVSALEEGESPRDFLQALVTNDVTEVLPVYAGLLTPQGKALFDFLVWADYSADSGRTDEDLLIDCEAEVADDLVKRLSLYRLRRKLGIARDEALAVHWQAHARPDAAADPRLAELGFRWIAPVSPQDESADAAWLSHRLALGVPEGRAELGDILWLEANAAELGGVSFGKGCYIGQENTARMNWRQKVNRRLVVVPLAESDEKRRQAAYAELGLAIDHRRVEDIAAPDAPDWLRAALKPVD